MVTRTATLRGVESHKSLRAPVSPMHFYWLYVFSNSRISSFLLFSPIPLLYFSTSGIDCGAPPSITNASFSLGTPNTTDLFSTAHYTCNAGYQSDGVDYSVCWWDGVWRPNITCISTVTIDCGVPPVISNGNRMWTVNRSADVGTTVAYSCAAGYDREGASEIACTASGQWTEPPKCTGTVVVYMIF